MKKVAIIGYGNVGYHLAKKLADSHQTAVFSRTPGPGVQPVSSFRPDLFDIIFLTVSDDAIEDVAKSFVSGKSLVIHTSGAKSLDTLRHHHHRGVIYPLQTFTKEKTIEWSKVKLLIEGTHESETIVRRVAIALGQDIVPVDSESRARIHLAAVLACNFSNHMYYLAESQLKHSGLTFQDLRPLLEETLHKALKLNPSKAQTGPAIRRDVSTLELHERIIEDEDLQLLYQMITKSIQTER